MSGLDTSERNVYNTPEGKFQDQLTLIGLMLKTSKIIDISTVCCLNIEYKDICIEK